MEPQRTQRSAEAEPFSSRRIRIPDWVLLAAVCFFFFFWKLAAFGLIGADEPRYAQVAREMLQRHDWITPTLGGTPWLEKPPLYYWQAMVAYRIFGVSDWAARLPSAVDATLVVFAVYGFFRRFRPGSQLDGSLMVAVAAGVVGYARAASMDMPLAATFSIALLSWFAWIECGSRKYLMSFWFFLALATLTKGPVAPFLAVIILCLFALLRKKTLFLTRSLQPAGILLFAIIALPWYVAVQLRNPHFFRVFILEHNLARFGTNLYHHIEPFWYYLPVSLLGWMPWSVVVVLAVVVAFRQCRAEDSDPLHTFLLVWIVVVVVFFSISHSKLPGYVLPAIPPGAMLAALWLRENRRPSMLFAGIHAACATALILAALMLPSFLLNHQWFGRAALVPLIAAVGIAAFIMLLVWRKGFAMLRFATLLPAIIVVGAALRSGARPINETFSARSLVEALSQYDHRHLPIATYLVPRETEFGLAFYRDQVIPRYEGGQVPAGEHLLVAAQGYPKGVTNAAGRKAIFLRNVPAQRLDLYYVPAK